MTLKFQDFLSDHLHSVNIKQNFVQLLNDVLKIALYKQNIGKHCKYGVNCIQAHSKLEIREPTSWFKLSGKFIANNENIPQNGDWESAMPIITNILNPKTIEQLNKFSDFLDTKQDQNAKNIIYDMIKEGNLQFILPCLANTPNNPTNN